MSPIPSSPVQSPLFESLSTDEIAVVYGFLKQRRYPSGSVVFEEGDVGEEIFIVQTGCIGSSVAQTDGTRRTIYEFGPGRFFGEMAVIEGVPRSAQCKAEEDSELLVLEGTDFFHLVFEHSVIGHKMLTSIGRVMVSWLDESSHFLNDLVRWGETARRRAVEDALTGLFNRRFLEESLGNRFSAISSGGRRFALVMMDLDRFHEINTICGARGGDMVIQAAAAAFKPALRDGDVAARLAGDEFAFLLPDTGKEDACMVADRLRRCVESLHPAIVPEAGGVPVPFNMSASLGVAVAPDQAPDTATLTAAADKALFAAKEAGRNRVIAAE